MTDKSTQPPKRRYFADPGECKTCDDHEGGQGKMMPSHDPSPLCESGGYPHCTCERCF